ncbi:hypothetical protein V500_10643 [Pseudogymnoascus sp. VKM F-4518 (FW-2643)]|nr:hypothetical protein V500_10643 [Pseudogymnoascus sp. VKM F-4518 (FW-2643)]
MDFLKKAAGELQNKSSGSAPAEGSAPAAGGSAPAAGGAAQSSDYGDKAFAAISKQSGHTFSADQSEKITDGIRGAYEKATGNKVDSKYSN